MAEVQKPATYADVEAAPEHLVAEIIDGRLVTHPRPTTRHAAAANELAYELTGPFRRGRGGPGGWVFLLEPEIKIGDDLLVPDIAGCRRERLPGHPETNYLSIVPDWVCEIISPPTEIRDRTAKRRIYAEGSVGYLWLLDPRQQLLEAFRLAEGQWVLAGTWRADEEVRAPPFDAIAFSLAELWPLDRPLGFEETPQAAFAGER